MHEEKPDIQRLQVHLPNQNVVLFHDSDNVHDIFNQEQNHQTTLIEWFVVNQTCTDANDLLYIDFPTKWVWNRGGRVWTRRQKGDTIG